MTNFLIKPNGATWRPNMQLMQVPNMQVVTFGDQLETIASGAMWSPNLVQVTESSSVSIVPLEIF